MVCCCRNGVFCPLVVWRGYWSVALFGRVVESFRWWALRFLLEWCVPYRPSVVEVGSYGVVVMSTK